MTTLTKIIVATIISLSLFSCSFNYGVKGNGNVTIEDRSVNESFTTIRATEGLNVYLTQSDTESITVEADENLQELIITEVENGILKIHTRENIGRSTSKKVMVSFKDISSITSTSGSNIYSTNTITVNNLELKSTSGSNMTLEVNTTNINSKSTSGSNLRLSGNTSQIVAEATSGSHLKAGDLNSESSEVKATSGANITINTSRNLVAKATSGGNVKYYGNPENVEKSDTVSGSISKG
jgi:hypothetical protein